MTCKIKVLLQSLCFVNQIKPAAILTTIARNEADVDDLHEFLSILWHFSVTVSVQFFIALLVINIVNTDKFQSVLQIQVVCLKTQMSSPTLSENNWAGCEHGSCKSLLFLISLSVSSVCHSLLVFFHCSSFFPNSHQLWDYFPKAFSQGNYRCSPV